MNETLQTPADESPPWWRVPMVWLVVGGPLSVVIASLATAVVAWRHIDPVITGTTQGPLRAGDEIATPASPKDALAPALKETGSFYEIPVAFYPALEQAAVIIKTSPHKALAREFLAFLRTPEAVRQMQAFGFALPPGGR